MKTLYNLEQEQFITDLDAEQRYTKEEDTIQQERMEKRK